MPTRRRSIDESTSIYQIFVRNYTEEGTLEAARRRLGEVAALDFDWVYLTPIHPIGLKARKGSLGSPYAIADYRLLDDRLGGIGDFSAFVAEAEGLGLKVMIDIVYNHTAPDSRLAMEHPDWFLTGPDGEPSRKCADWSDVVDLDYGSSPALWDELIDTLLQWRELGVSGFRCDVASLVPVEFWLEARRRVNRLDPESGEESRPTLWLAESVHPHFLKDLRDRGFGVWSAGELHAAFDLSYDYDGWERLEPAWAGAIPLERYLEYLFVQETGYPAGAKKLRFLENHDLRRAAERFSPGGRLESWTVFYQLLPGISFAYMGQEYAVAHRPSLFDRDPVRWDRGDPVFKDRFATLASATKRIKMNAPRFSWTVLADGVVRFDRRGEDRSYAALLNLDGRTGSVALGEPIVGVDALTGNHVRIEGPTEIPDLPLIVELN